MTGPLPPGPRGVAGLANLVLIGPMGSGKSSVAREIAHYTGRRWVDTDKLIVDHSRLSIADIFAAYGEARFRELETAALRSLEPNVGLIVATGGGIVTRDENVSLLRKLGVVAWLKAREDVLFERVSRNRRRPLLHTADPRATLRDLLVRRHSLYAACAHLTIDTSDDPHARIAETLLTQASELLASGGGSDRSMDAETAAP